MKSNLVLLALILASCQPEMPVTSSILVKGDGLTVPVNKELYGLTIEEINHAVDGGIYAELIQNRSFEDGVPPLNCPYDPVRHLGEVGDGLHQLDLAVEARLLVGDVDKVIHECAQEIALAELHHLNGCVLEDIAVVTGAFQNLVIQSFHLSVSFYQFALPFTGQPEPRPSLSLFYAVVYK